VKERESEGPRTAGPKPPANVLETPRLPFVASAVLAVLMVVQAGVGLVFRGQYRDVEWIRATWFGNDLVTLVLAAPLLATSLRLARGGSTRGLLLSLGVLWYGVYNYAFYLLGTALNPFFPLYAVLVVLSALTLTLGLARMDAAAVRGRFGRGVPVRLVGGYFVLLAVGLAIAWTAMWAAHVFAGQPLPVPPDAFRLVAALDLVLMVPALASGGLLLWRRRAWGYVIATVAGVQGSLYLLVLSVNSAIAIVRGLAAAPGELPVWGTLALATAAATALLLANVRAPRER
jgi:hypothetical protein